MRRHLTRIAAFRPASPLAVTLAGVGLLALLAVVAAASRSHHTPGGHQGGHAAPSGARDYVFTIVLVLFVAVALFFLYLWFSERDLLAQRRRQQKRGSYRALVLILAVALLVSVVSRFHNSLGLGKGIKAQNPTVHSGQRAKQKKHPQTPQQAPAPELKLVPVFVATAAGLVLLGFIGLRAMRRARSGLLESYQLEQEFESLLDDTLSDLYAERDARRAIIKAYGRMERLFALYGLPRNPSEAPMEYLWRALGELRASGSALRRLTSLFQWAKFSQHEISGTMRDDAIAALTLVRDELHANRIERDSSREQAESFRREIAEKAAKDERTFGKDPFEEATQKAMGSVYGRRGV